MKTKQLPTPLLDTYKTINKIDDNSWDAVQYVLLNFKKLADNAGYSFVEALKICSETAGLLDAKKISFLIKPGFVGRDLYNADLAAEVISSGVVTTDKFHGPLLRKGGEFNGTLRDYVIGQDLPQVLNALNQPLVDTQKIINNINDNSELITNTLSIINPVQVFSENSKVEVKDFDHGFQDAYLGAILNGGGNSCIYALKSEPNKIIRISQASGYHDSISIVMDVNDWLQNKLAYKNVCNLVAFKNKYPELPVAQIDDVFFIRAQKVISPYKFGNKDSVDSIKGNTDFYYMATIMEKLIDEHPDLDSDAVINAQAIFKKLNIGIEDFKERNVVKKICKELVENDYISYEVPVFIDYDEWTVPTIGESDSVAFA